MFRHCWSEVILMFQFSDYTKFDGLAKQAGNFCKTTYILCIHCLNLACQIAAMDMQRKITQFDLCLRYAFFYLFTDSSTRKSPYWIQRKFPWYNILFLLIFDVLLIDCIKYFIAITIKCNDNFAIAKLK